MAQPVQAGITQSLRLWRFFAPRLVRIRDFSGGLNLREAPPELAPNESPDLWNVTLDERGGVAKRLGYVKVNNTPYPGGLVQRIEPSGLLGDDIVQAGADLYLGTNVTPRHTFSTSARVGVCDFNGKVWALHYVDGLYSSVDGVTWAQAGGRGAVTVTIASPAVFTLNNHGLSAGDQVIFRTTGALPTGITAGTTYFVISAGLTANAFEVSTTAAGAAVNTSGSQSGVHTLFFPVPKGDSITAWQNRLVCNDATTAAQVNASTIGDGDDWRTSTGHGWTNQIRENPRDSSRILCLAAASGVDIVGRPGLIACKRDSTYRLNDSNTGAYQTLDTTVGAASGLSVTTSTGRTVILSRLGIFWTDGVSALVKASLKVDPLFTPDTLAEDQLDLCAAGSYGDRCYFSIPRKGQTANNLAIEFHPLEGWIVIGSNAASCYATHASSTQRLYTGSPSVTGQTYQQLKGGSDDGAPIASWFQSKWFEPNDGFFTRFRKVRILGRGSFKLYTRADYSTAQGVERDVSITGGGFVWGTGVWGTGVWGPATYATYSSPLLTLGTGRAVSFRIEETSSLSTTAPPLPGTTDALEVGGWSLEGIDLEHFQLGIQ